MSYPGGKGASGVAQTIINQQPPHFAYVEPFFGGGTIMRAKRPAEWNEGLDLDESILPSSGTSFPYPQFQFHHGCGISFLNEVGSHFGPNELVYCDPPYLLSTRRRVRRLYQYEMTEDDHERLLATLCRLNCMVQISGYWSSLYAERLEGWRLIRFTAMTRGGTAEECLWMNYPEPKALHDYRFLGSSFRDRERIKRKTERWRSRIAKLPYLERRALISAIACDVDIKGEASCSDGSRRIPAASTMHDRGEAEVDAR